MTEKEYQKAYREKHREEKMEYDRKYYQEHKEIIKDNAKRWAEQNPDRCRELRKARLIKYRNTPKGRANHLLAAYNKSDEKNNRGKGDLTPQWIVENIFSKPCAHCGKTGWQVIGCNRIDNDKPHTKDNVEPCCRSCNAKEQAKEIKGKAKHISQFTLDGELVKEWNSIKEAGENGYEPRIISLCYLGKRKTHKGYIWKRHM